MLLEVEVDWRTKRTGVLGSSVSGDGRTRVRHILLGIPSAKRVSNILDGVSVFCMMRQERMRDTCSTLQPMI